MMKMTCDKCGKAARVWVRAAIPQDEKPGDKWKEFKPGQTSQFCEEHKPKENKNEVQ